MNDQPKISIITPLYKAEKFIKETIESVQNQTYRTYEHIIIDDCSPDNSYAIAEMKAMSDNQIILFRNEKNYHVAYTRNFGLDIATGDYIMFLDADDILFEDSLEILVNCFKLKPQAFIYTAPCRKISEDGLKLFGILTPPAQVGYKDMLKTCTMVPLTTMLNRKVIGNHRFKSINHEDYLFWLDILKDGNYTCYGYREKPLGYYRLTSNSLSRNKLKTFRYQWNIYRNEIRLGFFESIYNFIFYAINGLYKYLK